MYIMIYLIGKYNIKLYIRYCTVNLMTFHYGKFQVAIKAPLQLLYFLLYGST